MSIPALITNSTAEFGIVFGEIDRPQPDRDEVLIRNRAISLNFGETRRAKNHVEPDGVVLGWDTAGVIAAVGTNVTEFAVGDRVVSRNVTGGWAVERTAHRDDVAVLPDSVSFTDASTLPTAAVTAYLVLQRFGTLLGKRILITGASGGVGRFAIQLARLGGATVVASVGSTEHIDELTALGAHEVVVGAQNVTARVDGVLESVGGDELFNAFEALGNGGLLQTIGGASGLPTTFPPQSLLGDRTRTIVPHRSTEHRVARPLTNLLTLVAEGRLELGIKWTGPWQDYNEAAARLLGRRLAGKAVLEVTE
jgi:NADPH2:quinone reductase